MDNGTWIDGTNNIFNHWNCRSSTLIDATFTPETHPFHGIEPCKSYLLQPLPETETDHRLCGKRGELNKAPAVLQEKCDVRCLQCGLPKESLEQHLLSFLTQKFGLRPLIAEWLWAVLTAVAAFCHVDAHVDIFGKILLNELDETARYRPVTAQ
jgi:hypothetical protein